MPGSRAYTLIDVLKQINDQSTPTVEDLSNEIINLLIGAATFPETLAGADQPTTSLQTPPFVWAPAGTGQNPIVWNEFQWS